MRDSKTSSRKKVQRISNPQKDHRVQPDQPEAGPNDDLIALQQTIGNRAVGKLLGYSGPPAVQRKSAEQQPEGQNRPDQGIQVKQRMESAFGRSFSNIALHTGARATSRANSLEAKAYIDGDEIGFSEGEFSPERPEGLHTIAHEFAHAAQAQSAAGGETVQDGGALRLAGASPASPGPSDETQLIEANAQQAADDVVQGRTPAVRPANLTTIARDDKTSQQNIPPRGSFFVAPLQGGGYNYIFNGDDALSWKNRAITVFTYYMNDNYPGVTDQVIANIAQEVDMKLEDVKDAEIQKFKYMRVAFDANVESTIRKKMKKRYPQYSPSRPQGGSRTLTGANAPQKPTGQTTAPAPTETGKTDKPAEKAPVFSKEDQKLADELANMSKGAKSPTKIDPAELVRLYKLTKATVQDPTFDEKGESLARFARFLEKNKDKIEGILQSGQKGNLTQDQIEKVVAEYEKFIAATPIDKESEDKLEKLEDFNKEFSYDPGWQQLSAMDRKLLVDYAVLKPEEITKEKVDFKKVTANMKVSMALKLADKSLLGEVKDAAEAAFSDPTFLVTLVVMMGIYVGLWITPDPTLITKIAAAALTAALLIQFGWDDIIGTVRAYFDFKNECDMSFDVDQLRQAGNKFMKKLGTTGFDIIMFIVMWRIGKRVGPKVQKFGARRGVVRAEGKLATAESKPGSGTMPQAPPDVANLLNQAKATAADPANPTSVLDSLAKTLTGDAKTGLEKFRKIGDSKALNAIESVSSNGQDIRHFLTAKGMTDVAIKAAKGDLAKAKVDLARAKLIEAETVKDPALREAARAEQYKALIELLREYKILRDPKVQKAIVSRDLNALISAIGEAIARVKMRAKPGYTGNKNFKVRTNLAVVREVPGYRTVADWRAAEKARINSQPNPPKADVLEKQLSRAAARYFDQGGKLYEAIGEIDVMVTEDVKGGKPRPVEVGEVKTGGADKASDAANQINQSVQGLADVAAKTPGYKLFERTGHNEIGKDLSNEFDLSQVSSVTKTTFGLEGKSGFSESLEVSEDTIIGLAESLVKSLPPKGTTPSLPPPSDTDEE